MKLLKLLFFLPFLFVSSSAATCSDSDQGRLLTRAFAAVPKFNALWVFNSTRGCRRVFITDIRVPARNLTGTVDWKSLANITTLRVLDLSGNSLTGTLPSYVWLLPALVELNVANNRLGGKVGAPSNLRDSLIQRVDVSFNRFKVLGDLSNLATHLTSLNVSGNNFNSPFPLWLANLSNLQFLDISGCNFSGNVNPVSGLRSLTHLDVSRNHLTGNFSGDFPPLEHLQRLNVSFNNFSGVVASNQIRRFGTSAFLHGGNHLIIERQNRPPVVTTTSPDLHQSPHNPIDTVPVPQTENRTRERGGGVNRRTLIAIVSAVSSLVLLTGVLCFTAIYKRKQRNREAEKWSISMPIQIPPFRIENEKSGPFSFETESGSSWVADIREPTSAPVILFEKPLMSHLSFKDLMVATSHFGKESLMAEGRSGPVYRAVLPGELHVVIKVLENVRHVPDAEEMFRHLSMLRHPNLLPICGYCIAGTEKMVLTAFMGNGDLRRWLRELPTGAANVEDWSGDTWEIPQDNSPDKLAWRTRYRIAVGVARGVAYLHHAGSKPVVHGHLVLSNVLLDDDLVPRVTDFGLNPGGSTAEDVYHFGIILMELLTYDFKLGSVDKIRRLVKDRRGMEALDQRLRDGEGSASSEMVKCLQVAYLCTADAPEKRPSMQQVVGLLKDIHPSSSSA